MTRVPVPDYVVTPRRLDLMDFMRRVHPNPVSTLACAYRSYTTESCALGTAERKAWRDLDKLRTLGLVTATKGPSSVGRSPAFWGLTGRGRHALVEAGRATELEIAQLSRTNRSTAFFVRRYHDQIVTELAARWFELCRLEPKFELHVLDFNRELPNREDGLVSGIRPDLTVVVSVRGHRVLCLCEVQTERPALSAAGEKARILAQYVAAGRSLAEFDCSSARIIVVTVSDEAPPKPLAGHDHRTNIAEVIAEVPGLERLARITCHLDLRRDGLACPIFLRPMDLLRARAELPDVLAPARHRGNAVRAKRDAALAERVELCRWFD